MHSRTLSRMVVVPAAVWACLLSVVVQSAVGQEAVRQKPVLTVHVAGVDRLKEQVRFLIDAANQREIADQFMTWLDGLERIQALRPDDPVGMFLFMGTGLIPQPTPVAFLPLNNVNDAPKVMGMRDAVVRKSATQENRYELVRGERIEYMHASNGYVFICNNELILDGEIPDPREVINRHAAGFDLAARVDLTAVPEGMKTILLESFRANAEAELQRRDNEPELAYRLRRANGVSTLEFLEQVATQGEQLTLGWKVNRDAKAAAGEVVVDAKADSAFSKYLHDLGGKASRFAGLATSEALFTLTLSWQMVEREKNVLVELLRVAEMGVTRQLIGEEVDAESELPTTIDPTMQALIAPLIATAEKGHLDLFAQLSGDGPEEMVFVGGMHVLNAGAMATPLRQILEKLQPQQLELNFDTFQGVAIHSVHSELGARDERLYGARARAYFGVGDNTLWFALGGTNALPVLKQTMDAIAFSAADGPTALQRQAPLRIVANAGRFLELQADEVDSEGENRRRRPLRDLANDAFAPGGDQIRIDFRPTESGARLRVELDDGFLRLIGLTVGRRFERQQQRERERQLRDAERRQRDGGNQR